MTGSTVVITLAATLWAAWSTMDRYFLGDDFGYVSRFLSLSWKEWLPLFYSSWAGDIWGYVLPELRPFAALTFMLDGSIWGANPLGYHLTSWALYAVCALLVAALVRILRPDKPWWGAAASLLFAVYPAHAEPVAWITGRVDLLGTAFYLGGFLAALHVINNGSKPWLCLTWLCYGAGIFSKEFCLTLPLLILSFMWIYAAKLRLPGGRAHLALFGGYVVMFLVYVVCRRIAFGSRVSGGVSADFLGEEYMGRQIDYLGWMFPPFLRWIQGNRDALLVNSRWLVPTLGAGFLVALILWRRLSRFSESGWREGLFFGFVWYWVATLPLVVVTYFSPRHLFFATAGVCIFFVLILGNILRSRGLAILVLGAVTLYFGSQYAKEVTRWRHAAKVSELVSRAVERVQKTRVAKIAILLDVPDVFEGCWTWSWSSPFAVRPPFMEGSSKPIFERPSVFFLPSQWRQRHDFSQLELEDGAYLVSIGEGNVPTTQFVGQGQLRQAAQQLKTAFSKSTDDDAWARFLSNLNPP